MDYFTEKGCLLVHSSLTLTPHGPNVLQEGSKEEERKKASPKTLAQVAGSSSVLFR